MSAPAAAAASTIACQSALAIVPSAAASSSSEAHRLAAEAREAKRALKRAKWLESSPHAAALANANTEREWRILTACHDEQGVFVYQAYKPSIGLAAAERGSFADIADFSPTRMTWIKFSLGWMMYRCDYARSKDQEVVLRVKISWEALWAILREGVGSFWDQRVYSTKDEWQTALSKSCVRWQWDPERDAHIVKMPKNQRALQLGVKGEIGQAYATNPAWILTVEDVTSLVKEIRECIDEGRPLPALPHEREIVITDPQLRQSMGMMEARDSSSSSSLDAKSQPAAAAASPSSTD